MKVDKKLVEKALINYIRTYRRAYLHVEDSFLAEMGITIKQWHRFQQTGKLHVCPCAAAKIRLEALDPSNPHRHALRKVLEIQYAQKSPGD